MNTEKVLKLLRSSYTEDIRLGIEFLLSMGYNKANNIVKLLSQDGDGNYWRCVGCDTRLWGYYNSSRGTFRIIIAYSSILVIYESEEYVRDKLNWKNLEL